MSCEIEIGHFPDDLGCIKLEGYVATVFRKTKYLGHKTATTKKPIVDAILIVDREYNEVAFLEWWVTTLKHGTLPFYIEMKFFGITHHMEFNFISNISEVLKDGYRDNPVKLELLNVAHVLERPDYIYELICGTDALCDDQLICT